MWTSILLAVLEITLTVQSERTSENSLWSNFAWPMHSRTVCGCASILRVSARYCARCAVGMFANIASEITVSPVTFGVLINSQSPGLICSAACIARAAEAGDEPTLLPAQSTGTAMTAIAIRANGILFAMILPAPPRLHDSIASRGWLELQKAST